MRFEYYFLSFLFLFVASDSFTKFYSILQENLWLDKEKDFNYNSGIDIKKGELF